MNRSRRHKTNAFTMIELMLVIGIMIILGLLAALGVSEVIVHANVKETQSTMHLIEIALDQFKADMGDYPFSKGSDAGGEGWETFVTALAEPASCYGWKRASFAGWFENRDEVRDEDEHLRLPDAWDKDFSYCSSRLKPVAGGVQSEYRFSGRGVERTPGKEDYYNLQTYQIYSNGPNMETCPNGNETWPHVDPADPGSEGDDRLCGTQRDDVRNWRQETFYSKTPPAYQ